MMWKIEFQLQYYFTWWVIIKSESKGVVRALNVQCWCVNVQLRICRNRKNVVTPVMIKLVFEFCVRKPIDFPVYATECMLTKN